MSTQNRIAMKRKQEKIAKKVEKLLAKADLKASSIVMYSKEGIIKTVVVGDPAIPIANVVALDDYTKKITEGKIKTSYENAKKMARNLLGIDANHN